MIVVLFRLIHRSIHSLRRLSSQLIESFMTPDTLERRYVNQILKYTKQQRLKEAFHIAQKAIALNTRFHIFYDICGLYYWSQGEFDKAIEEYNRAIALCPDDPELYGYLYDNRGQVWCALEEHERAIADFDIAIAATPKSESFLNRGESYFELGRYKEALKDYDDAINLLPDARVYTARGRTLIQLQKYVEASTALDKATRLDPDDYEPYLKLGNIYQYEEHYESAIEKYDKAISLIAEDSLGNKMDSSPLGYRGKYAVYEGVIRNLVAAFANRSACQVQIGDNTKALADIDDAIELLPESATLYVVRSLINFAMDEHARALKDLSIAIEHDSNFSELFFVRANIHATQKAYKEAIEDIDRAIALSRDSGLFYLEKGRLLLHAKQYDLAIGEFDRVIELELDTSHGTVKDSLTITFTQGLYAHTKYTYRALAYLLLGNRKMARSDLFNAKDLGLTQVEIEEEIAELFSDKTDRHSVLDFVKRIVADRRAGVTGKVRASILGNQASERRVNSDKDSLSPVSKKWNTLSKEQYTDVFKELGFYDISTGKTLKHQKSIPSIYFNSRYDSVFFVIYAKDKHRFHSSLWKQLPPQRRKDTKPKLLTVVPRDGKKLEAFKQLLSLSSNTSFR